MDSKSNINDKTNNKTKDNIILGYVYEFINENKLWFFVTMCVIFISNPLEMIVLSNLFTSFTNAINKLDYDNSISILWKIAGLYFFIDIIYTISSYFDKIHYPKLEKFIRFKLIDVIFKNIEVNYDNENISNIIVKLLNIPNLAIVYTQNFIYSIFTFCITIFSILVYITYANIEVGAIMVFIFIVYFIIFYYILKQIKNKSSEREREEKILMTHVDDVLSNALSVIACKKIPDEKEYLDNKHTIYDKSSKEQLWYTSRGVYIVSFINTIVLVISVYIILRFYKTKKITSKTTIQLIIIILFFIRYLKTSTTRIIHIMVGYGKISESAKCIKDILNDTITNGDKKDFSISGSIEFKNVSFEYPNKDISQSSQSSQPIESNEEHPVSDNIPKIKSLDNVSFKINPLDRVAIIGTNGSGKSTIIKLIMGFYSVSGGEVLHNGVNVLEINREYLRSKIAIINQKVVLFNRPIIENICYGNNIPKEKVKQILKKLHVVSVFKNQPQGLETFAGLHGGKLSGGQKQIIYLLRCYLSNKPIIIMDEPTAAVDSIHKKYIMRMIDEMSKKSTLIVVTHDPEYAAAFPTKIYIEGGKIVKSTNANDSSMPYDDYNNFGL